MANDNTVTMVLEVDSKDAQKAIEQFGASSIKSVKNTESAFAGLGSTLSGLTGPLLSIGALFAAVANSISEAAQEEKSIRALGLAIAGTGEYTKVALDGLVEYANTLSDLSGIDDEIILQNLSLAKSFGITNDQAEKLTTAAVNLSAITGQDLQSSVRQLGQTFDGTIGKLGNLGGEFRNLSEEQARNGAVIDLINKKYGEAGVVIGDTFQGSLDKLKKSFGDAFKEIGKEVLKEGSLKSSIDLIAGSVVGLGKVLGEVTTAFLVVLKGFSEGYLNLAFILTNSLKGITGGLGLKSIEKSLNETTISLAETILKLQEAPKAVDDTTSSANKLDNVLIKISDSAKSAGKESIKVYEELSTLIGDFASELEKDTKKVYQTLAKIQAAEKRGEVTRIQALEFRDKVIAEFTAKNIKRTKEAADKEAEEIKKSLGDLGVIKFTAEFRGAFGESITDALEGIDLNNFAKGLGSAITTALKGGDEKARFQGIGAVISGVLSAYLGPLGAVLGDFITQLSQNNKEQTKEFIKEFINSAPDFVLAIADNLPAIVEGLVEVLTNPDFWLRAGKAFINGILSIYLKATSAVYIGIFDAIRNAFSGAIPAMVQGLNEAFGRLANIFQGVIQFFRDSFQPLIDAFNGLKAAIETLTEATGKGGGRGIIAEAGGKGGGKGIIAETFGFAKGGIVYAADGFVSRGTDTVPAMLTPGEMVIPTDLVGQLASFLSGQTGGGAMKSDAILMAILQAVQQPVTVNSSVKVNQSAFADIILQLNRQNARLTA